MRLPAFLLVTACTLALAACSAGDEAKPADGLFSVRPVLAVGVPSTYMRDGAVDVITQSGVDPTDEGADVLAWLETGDCEVTAPEPTRALAVGCDPAGNGVLLAGEVLIGAESIASIELREGEWDQLALTFDDTGTTELANATAAARERSAPENRLALMVDGNVVAAPSVMDTIDNGEVVISGGDLSEVAEVLKPLAN